MTGWPTTAGDVGVAATSRAHRRPGMAGWIDAGVAVIAGIVALTLVLAHRGPDEGDPTPGNPRPVTSSAPSTTSSVAVPAPAPPVVSTAPPPPPTTTAPTTTPPPTTTTLKTSPAAAYDAVCAYLHSLGDQWPDDPYLYRWMLERYPDLPPNQAINILETAFHDPACQGPA